MKRSTLPRSLWGAFVLDSLTTGGSATEPAVLPDAVHLIEAADLIGCSVRYCMEGLGFGFNEGAACTVCVGLVGTQFSAQQLMAAGGATLNMQAESGFAVKHICPGDGRVIICHTAAGAFWPDHSPFVVTRYPGVSLLTVTLLVVASKTPGKHPA